MLGKLVPCGGGAVMPLLKPKLIVGRKPECDVVIACSSVSGRHCELEIIDGAWWVRDLQSKNGTSVNGKKIERYKIAPNNLLTLGRQRFMVEYQPPKKPTAPSGRDAEDDLALEFLMNDPDQKSAPELPTTADFEKSSPVLKTVTPPPRPQPVVDFGKLVPCGGGAPIPLRAAQLVLGRSPECDVRIRFPSVSSRHCKLSFEDGYWMVEDLNSTNGTWVDGDRCELDCLMPDSILALDKHRFTIQYTPTTSNPPPVVKKLFKQSLLEKAGLVNKLSDYHLGGEELPEDDFDRPKRYNLLEDDE